MRRKKPRSSESKLTLEMTPMIDVVFNLLIFFLCSPFKIPEGQLDAFLPKGLEGKPPPVPIEKVLVVLRDTGRDTPDVFVGRNRLRVDADGPVFDDLALDLIDRKEKWAEVSEEKLPVEIDSDTGVRYRYVVGVLNACTKAGIEDIRFTLPIGGPEKPPG